MRRLILERTEARRRQKKLRVSIIQWRKIFVAVLDTVLFRGVQFSRRGRQKLSDTVYVLGADRTPLEKGSVKKNQSADWFSVKQKIFGTVWLRKDFAVLGVKGCPLASSKAVGFGITCYTNALGFKKAPQERSRLYGTLREV